MNVQLALFTAGCHTEGDKLLNNGNVRIDTHTHLQTSYAAHVLTVSTGCYILSLTCLLTPCHI